MEKINTDYKRRTWKIMHGGRLIFPETESVLILEIDER